MHGVDCQSVMVFWGGRGVGGRAQEAGARKYVWAMVT